MRVGEKKKEAEVFSRNENEGAYHTYTHESCSSGRTFGVIKQRFVFFCFFLY